MNASGASDETKLGFLRETGVAGLTHVRTPLLDHLVATRDLLEGWGAPPAWCDAALFHAVYGTKELGRQVQERLLPASARDRVRALIGGEAERLVWLFGKIRPRRFVPWVVAGAAGAPPMRRGAVREPLSEAELRALCNLLVANALEQLPRRRYGQRRRARQLILLEPWLLPGALAALKDERSWRRRLRRRLEGVPERGRNVPVR